MLKLTLPTVDDFYRDLVEHPKVLRVVALSGGYPRDEANEILARNHGVIASFSRALTENLSAKQTDEEFDAALGRDDRRDLRGLADLSRAWRRSCRAASGDLLLRAFAPADAPALAAYRSDAGVARYQSWDTPYPLEAAAAFIAGMAGMDGPVPGDWIQIAVEVGGELAGDVAVGLEQHGLVATIGYTLAPTHQGRGIGRRAVGAVVDALFGELGVHRVQAELDPRNVASARLVETLGFAHEGVLASSVLAKGEWTDDARYGLSADGHAAWRVRPRHRPTDVALVEITPATSRAVLGAGDALDPAPLRVADAGVVRRRAVPAARSAACPSHRGHGRSRPTVSWPGS